MSTRRQSLFAAILARISLGAVPVDGTYWFEPKDAKAHKPRRATASEADWSPMSLPLARRHG